MLSPIKGKSTLIIFLPIIVKKIKEERRTILKILKNP